jgi:hypothetical protein
VQIDQVIAMAEENIPVLSPPMFDSSRLRPGMVAAVSGIYRAHHYRHRSPHIVFIEAGTILPECRRCGHVVEFAPLIAARAIETDDDLCSGLTAAG